MASTKPIVVGASLGGWWGTCSPPCTRIASTGAVLLCPANALGEPVPERLETVFDEEVETEEGWRGCFNRHYMLRNFPGFAAFFASKVVSEPHALSAFRRSSRCIPGPPSSRTASRP